MSVLFANRREAGRRLALRLQRLKGRPDLIVLGLPRGGIPVAFEVARALAAPLDLFVVRKLGVPGHEELAMGAVASGGLRVVNQDVVRQLGVTRQTFDAITEEEEREVQRRDREYRMGRPFPSLQGKTVILVDDGVATGSTMLAAVHALRELSPEGILVASPVMTHEAVRSIAQAADAVEYVAAPEPFYGVGAHYEDFTQTADEEVRRLLGEAATSTGQGRVSHAERA
ncbi:MAG TPA: phosphoribosyltransferase family protein [Gemmatimonadales bacterium]|jgi:predicted phosphoribosyltransferase